VTRTFRTLLEEIAGFRILDTHEHLPPEKDLPKAEADVLAVWLSQYFDADLVSAGLPVAMLNEVRNPRLDLRDRWQRLEPFWRVARHTGYGRALVRAAADLFHVPEITAHTIGSLQEAFRAARTAHSSYYRWLLGEQGRIALSVVDRPGPLNLEEIRNASEPFVFTHRVTPYHTPGHRLAIQKMGEEVGVRVHTLEDWEETIRRHLKRALLDTDRVVCLKLPDAYHRPLFYPRRTRAEAEAAFHERFQAAYSPASHGAPPTSSVLQDYLLHEILRFADAHGVVVQVHTGIQAGNGNVVTDSNPTLLTSLFLEYSNVRFDLFHMGYPYQQEAAVLAKTFPNVFLDMCWAHIIGPEAARRALSEWLDSVPANKIMGFGGDYHFPEGVYGHQAIARENIAAVLADKVDRGDMGQEDAREVARWLLVDNPAALFGLGAYVH